MLVRDRRFAEIPKIESGEAPKPPTRTERILELVVVSVAASIVTQIVMNTLLRRRSK